MWLDNQYMVVTPWGQFRWGLLDAPGQQWMQVDSLAIEPGPEKSEEMPSLESQPPTPDDLG
jgi:hypothetical protein